MKLTATAFTGRNGTKFLDGGGLLVWCVISPALPDAVALRIARERAAIVEPGREFAPQVRASEPQVSRSWTRVLIQQTVSYSPPSRGQVTT